MVCLYRPLLLSNFLLLHLLHTQAVVQNSCMDFVFTFARWEGRLASLGNLVPRFMRRTPMWLGRRAPYSVLEHNDDDSERLQLVSDSDEEDGTASKIHSKRRPAGGASRRAGEWLPEQPACSSGASLSSRPVAQGRSH